MTAASTRTAKRIRRRLRISPDDTRYLAKYRNARDLRSHYETKHGTSIRFLRLILIRRFRAKYPCRTSRNLKGSKSGCADRQPCFGNVSTFLPESLALQSVRGELRNGFPGRIRPDPKIAGVLKLNSGDSVPGKLATDLWQFGRLWVDDRWRRIIANVARHDGTIMPGLHEFASFPCPPVRIDLLQGLNEVVRTGFEDTGTGPGFRRLSEDRAALRA